MSVNKIEAELNMLHAASFQSMQLYHIYIQ